MPKKKESLTVKTDLSDIFTVNPARSMPVVNTSMTNNLQSNKHLRPLLVRWKSAETERVL
ncbi:hypothetical protein [Neobacillus cucumis]|uniref:hypothetical protein n=1 Tax=Neobacillus cucumis TaxID=1740721 RepID=UPI0028532D38|nr:hypothetical protein [Neobacillus cucumis]MDR4945234.1 hypothetical protein [Neobacillus cucumis]